MVNTDNKVQKVLIDTETLIMTYNKRVGEISKNVENTKKLKEEVTLRTKLTSEKVDKIDHCCNLNHDKALALLERIDKQFQTDTIDQSA